MEKNRIRKVKCSCDLRDFFFHIFLAVKLLNQQPRKGKKKIKNWVESNKNTQERTNSKNWERKSTINFDFKKIISSYIYSFCSQYSKNKIGIRNPELEMFIRSR